MPACHSLSFCNATVRNQSQCAPSQAGLREQSILSHRLSCVLRPSRTSAKGVTHSDPPPCGFDSSCNVPAQGILYKTWGPANVDGGLGMEATDAYHAGSVRQQLIQQLNAMVPEYGMTVKQLALVGPDL